MRVRQFQVDPDFLARALKLPPEARIRKICDAAENMNFTIFIESPEFDDIPATGLIPHDRLEYGRDPAGNSVFGGWGY